MVLQQSTLQDYYSIHPRRSSTGQSSDACLVIPVEDFALLLVRSLAPAFPVGAVAEYGTPRRRRNSAEVVCNYSLWYCIICRVEAEDDRITLAILWATHTCIVAPNVAHSKRFLFVLSD